MSWPTLSEFSGSAPRPTAVKSPQQRWENGYKHDIQSVPGTRERWATCWLVGDPEFKSLQNPSDHHHALAGGKVYVLQCRQLFISSWPASTLVFPQVAQARNMSIGEHRLALLRNIRNIRICKGKKNYRFCNLRKWKDFNKKMLTLLKMFVTSLLCGPWADLWPVYGFLCKRFSLYMKVYQGWALQPSSPTDPLNEKGRKFASTAPIASKFCLGNTR